MSTAQAFSERSAAAVMAEIGRMYRQKSMSPYRLGCVMAAAKERYQLSHEKMSKLSGGISIGTLHHYISVGRDLDPVLQSHLVAGRIVFKVARAIADLPLHRQQEIAALFLNGKRSSLHVERVVALAKANPMMSADDLYAAAVESPRAPDFVPSVVPEQIDGQKCPRCIGGRLIVRPDVAHSLSYISCLHCGYEAPEMVKVARL